jgi:hypothetical protein
VEARRRRVSARTRSSRRRSRISTLVRPRAQGGLAAVGRSFCDRTVVRLDLPEPRVPPAARHQRDGNSFMTAMGAST